MARPTYHCRTLTVGKTPLGESDLIITALREDGSLLRAVAKGARKPTNPFAARLEIFSVCDCLIAEGKNLHVFSEARTVQSNLNIRSDFNLSASSYPIVQAIAKTCHEGLESPRIFDMTTKALATMSVIDVESSPSITAAFLLKLLALEGFRPNFSNCVMCGAERGDGHEDGSFGHFSYLDGGYVCQDCSSAFDTVKIESSTLSWSQALLMSTFEEIADMHVSSQISFPVLHLCNSWFRQNLGLNLKSLNALLSYGSL